MLAGALRVTVPMMKIRVMRVSVPQRFVAMPV